MERSTFTVDRRDLAFEIRNDRLNDASTYAST